MSGRGTRLSVLLITLNEERLLGRVLESVRWADEIVIVDSGSTDATEEIARRYTEHFHVREYTGEGEQRRRSLELSSGEWILYVDGDEVVTPELAASIQAAIRDPRGHAGFRMQLHTRFLGQWFGTRGWRREWKTRLFHRERGHFSPVRVHSGSVVDGPVGTLDGALLHYPYRDIDHVIAKLNRYSTMMAASSAERGVGVAAPAALARGSARFLRDYLLGGDFLYGGAGLLRSAINGTYTFLKYAKQWESIRGVTAAQEAAEPELDRSAP